MKLKEQEDQIKEKELNIQKLKSTLNEKEKMIKEQESDMKQLKEKVIAQEETIKKQQTQISSLSVPQVDPLKESFEKIKELYTSTVFLLYRLQQNKDSSKSQH